MYVCAHTYLLAAGAASQAYTRKHTNKYMHTAGAASYICVRVQLLPAPIALRMCDVNGQATLTATRNLKPTRALVLLTRELIDKINVCLCLCVCACVCNPTRR